ncbi:hypothetical protein I2I11_14435 [Pontibacter sp. 172403-2]|uniref:hypothetical protein n=1 Tax=Pontibacter rufus TaxID=2791028 RepID=UPI0018AF681F|nr:hypothetical protein [Pontibacter sp. 172403-2]MBF9254498.1 hypothetical protein [Pontibacter sp. 172403-2]
MARLTYTFLALLAFLGAAVTACTSDNSEDIDPQPKPQPEQCDTTNVTFAKTVSPILAANCYSCHSSSVATNGVVLDTYAGVQKQANNGNLVGVITHAPGYPPMPQGGAKLPACDINKIKSWVKAGAPNN